MTAGRSSAEHDFVQLKVWHTLQTVSADAETIAQMSGINRASARKACVLMRDKGLVKLVRVNRRWAIFYAVPGRKQPTNKSGRVRRRSFADTKASRFARWLKMMQKVHGPTWAYRPRNGHPLDNWRQPQDAFLTAHGHSKP